MVRDHSAAAPPVARIVPRGGERAPVLELARRRSGRRAEQPGRARALEHLDRGVLGDVGRELAQDPPPGRAAAGVHDAAGAVAALEPEREVAVAIGVEAHPERLELVEAGRRLGGEDLGGGAADELAARDQRVLRWSSGESSTASAAASPPWAQ